MNDSKFQGEIINLYTYYGVISFEMNQKKRKIPFFIKDNKYSMGDKVKFKIVTDKNLKIRGTNLTFAQITEHILITKNNSQVNEEDDVISLLRDKITDVDNVDKTNLYNFLNEKELLGSIGYITLLLRLVKNKITIAELRQIIEQDQKIKSFILKWTLFLEANVRNKICNEFEILDIDYLTLKEKIKSEAIKDSIKKVRKEYLLKGSLSDIEYEVTDSKEIPKIKNISLNIIMSKFTMGDLIEFIKELKQAFDEFDNSEWENIINELSEIKNIRNIAAHGDNFISEILDPKNNPNFLLQENSQIFGEDDLYKNDGKDDKIFNLIRANLKLGLKGVFLSSQEIAIKKAQQMLNNPTYRSLLYLIYEINKYQYKKESFNIELKELISNSKIVNLENINSNDPNIKFYNLLFKFFDYLKKKKISFESYGDQVYKVLYQNKEIYFDIDENSPFCNKIVEDFKNKTLNKEEFISNYNFLFVNNNYQKLAQMFQDKSYIENNVLNKLEGFEELQEYLNILLNLIPYTVSG